MASGTITLPSYGNQKVEGRISWSSTANGTVANNSTVWASIQVRKLDGYTTTGTWSGSLDIGGNARSYSIRKSISGSWTELLAFEITKSHNNDGTGSCYIYGRINAPSGTSLAGTRMEGSESVTLDRIARQASLTSTPNFNDEQNPTIHYSNPAGNAVEKLIAVISLDGSKNDIYREISKTGSSYTFVLIESEREILRKATQGSNSRTVYFYLGTDIAGQRYWEHQASTYTVVNTTPDLTPYVWDSWEPTVSATGNSDILVRDISEAEYSVHPVAKKGATISSVSVKNGSKTLHTETGTFSNPSSDTFVFTVTDSRGNTKTKTLKPKMVPYVRPTVNLTTKWTFAGEDKIDITLEVKGKFFNQSFGVKHNALSLGYKYKTQGGEWGNWIYDSFSLSYGSSNSYTATLTLRGLNYREAYVFEVTAKDTILSYWLYTDDKVVKAQPVFDWSKNDFNFNVPVKVKDNPIAYYPVGAIYMSLSSTSPASLFGGTWEKIEGKFLLGSSSSKKAGSTGGEESHKLTIDEMPWHKHDVTPNGNAGWYAGTTSGLGSPQKTDYGIKLSYDLAYGETLSRLVGSNVGGSKAHNNIPPYLAVNIWKRVS